MSGQFRRSDFLPDDMVSDLAVGPGLRAGGLGAAAPGPLGFLDLDERGGVGPNGKPSLLPGDAGTQITRTNARWSTNIGEAATVSYAFRSTAPVAMPNGTSGFTQFTAAQITATELMLQGWSDVARITFTRVGSGTSGPAAFSDAATMLFGNYSSGASGAAAFAYLAGNATHAASSGDVWVNSSLSYNANPFYMAYGYQVLLHEIGHAIGLSHPGDYNASNGSPSYNDASYYEDTRQYSVMSYWNEGITGASFNGRYSSAPLLDDIAAAQRLYGANTTTRTGDTVYGFNSTADRMWFNAGSELSPQLVIFAVWDAGGTDTLDFSGYLQGGVIDLRQGHFSSVGGMVGNVSIAMGAVIENAVGGSGFDTLVGNSGNNVLTGRGGDDNIWGGNGVDTAVFSGNLAAYTITYGTETIDGIQYRTTTVSGPDGTDVLRGVETLQFADQTFTVGNTLAFGEVMEGDVTSETLTGTVYADLIYGADGDDTINGGDGDDIITGGRGNDNMVGGNGNDLLDYRGATGSVTVNMTSGTSSGASGSDTFSGFERLRGSAFNDSLTGSAAGDTIDGGGGTDTLNGEGGNDYLIARDGTLVAADDVVKISTVANLSIATAVNIDANFDQMNDAGVVNATTVPHAVIRGSGSGGGQEYYAFTVTAGAAGVFDINGAGFDTTIRIFDASGNQLAWNDDGTAGTDSYLEYTFATAGTYYIAVGAWQSGTGEGSTTSGPVPYNGNYVLNVSIPGHSFVPTTGVGSTLNGGAGDDFLQSGSSNDILNGDDGTDTAVYSGARSAYTITDLGGGSYRITGPEGTGIDTLNSIERVQFSDQTITLGTPPVDPVVTFTGGNGDDNAAGGNNNDTLDGQAGNDTLAGRAGDDTIYGGEGDDTLIGDEGTDQLWGQGANDYVYGGEGNDILGGGEGTDQLWGQGGDDQAYGNEGDDLIGGGDGNDQLWGQDGNDQVFGNTGNDLIGGGTGNDRLWGQEGNDEVFGNEGDDEIGGGEGVDLLWGQDGNDAIYGGSGADTLDGGAGNDAIWGQEDNDVLYGGIGDDILGGGEGDDAAWGQDGNDVAYGGGGQDVLGGGDGADQLWGQEGNDTVYGGGGQDVLGGGDGDDYLYAQEANDWVYGEAGNDYIDGGAGTDELYGGTGADLFAFRADSETDIVFDFSQAEGDRIDLRGAGIESFSQAQGLLTQVGSDAVLTLSSGAQLRLIGMQATSLVAADFVFAAPAGADEALVLPGLSALSPWGKLDDAQVLPGLSALFPEGKLDDALVLPAGIDLTEAPQVLPLVASEDFLLGTFGFDTALPQPAVTDFGMGSLYDALEPLSVSALSDTTETPVVCNGEMDLALVDGAGVRHEREFEWSGFWSPPSENDWII